MRTTSSRTGLFHAMFTDRLTQSTPMFNMAKVYLAQHYGGITPTVQRYFEMYNLLGDPSIHTASFTANFGWVTGTVTIRRQPPCRCPGGLRGCSSAAGGIHGTRRLYLAGVRVDTAASTAVMTLRAQKFGYIAVTDTVTVVREDTVQRDIALARGPRRDTLAVHTFSADSAAMGTDVTIFYGGVPVVTGVTASRHGVVLDAASRGELRHSHQCPISLRNGTHRLAGRHGTGYDHSRGSAPPCRGAVARGAERDAGCGTDPLPGPPAHQYHGGFHSVPVE